MTGRIVHPPRKQRITIVCAAACSEIRCGTGSAPGSGSGALVLVLVLATWSVACQRQVRMPPRPPICLPRHPRWRTSHPPPRFCSLYGTQGEVVGVVWRGPVVVAGPPRLTVHPILRHSWQAPFACWRASHEAGMRHLKGVNTQRLGGDLCSRPLVLDMILESRLSYAR